MSQPTTNMTGIHASILLILSLAAQLAYGQKTTKNPARVPVETSVCKILSDPSAYNNRIVKVQGYVHASSEYSLLVDEHCDTNLLWLAFADGSVPPQLEMIVKGNGTSGGKDAKGNQIPPKPVHLVRDSHFEELEHYLNLNAKAANCANGPAPDLAHLPDCTTYRITATFTGRIDGVSKSVHESHLKRKIGEGTDWKGFGHMGMFDAQIVVTSIEKVVAVNESELHKPATSAH
jgi:hypothetical protein